MTLATASASAATLPATPWPETLLKLYEKELSAVITWQPVLNSSASHSRARSSLLRPAMPRSGMASGARVMPYSPSVCQCTRTSISF